MIIDSRYSFYMEIQNNEYYILDSYFDNNTHEYIFNGKEDKVNNTLNTGKEYIPRTTGERTNSLIYSDKTEKEVPYDWYDMKTTLYVESQD